MGQPKIQQTATCRIHPLLSEGKLAPITEVAAERGIEVHVGSALRWCLHGRRGVRLPSMKVGRRRLTTAAAFEWWLAAIQMRDESSPNQGMSPDEAERVLEAYGLGRQETAA